MRVSPPSHGDTRHSATAGTADDPFHHLQGIFRENESAAINSRR
jgi:hypothetical protein